MTVNIKALRERVSKTFSPKAHIKKQRETVKTYYDYDRTGVRMNFSFRTMSMTELELRIIRAKGAPI